VTLTGVSVSLYEVSGASKRGTIDESETNNSKRQSKHELDVYLANCYGEPIFAGNRATNLRKWAESHFRTLLVAVKRSELRTTLRSRNSE
jgi:hypothetical protein